MTSGNALAVGPDNAITDVAGIAVGNADDPAVRTGVTVVLPDAPAIGAVDVRGGGTGSREIALLAPEATIERVDAIVLSGGSVFGLDAAGAVVNALAARGRGLAIGGAVVPIVPQAILFDLANGGDKTWGETPPYPALARTALNAVGEPLRLGTVGAGYGAKAHEMKGGLGSASIVDPVLGVTIGAIVAVNAMGSPLIPGSRVFHAWSVEREGEFGGLRPDGITPDLDQDSLRPSGGASENTTIAVVATDARLSKAEAQRLAIMAQTGLARAIRPAHTPLDGDMVFALSTSKTPLDGDPRSLARLGGFAADVLARAIARGVYEATALPGLPAWRDLRA